MICMPLFNQRRAHYSFSTKPGNWLMNHINISLPTRCCKLANRVIQEQHLGCPDSPRENGGSVLLQRDSADHTPYVLMNFNGHPRDVSTLAHELGHAMHGMLAHQHSVLDLSFFSATCRNRFDFW